MENDEFIWKLYHILNLNEAVGFGFTGCRET